MKKVVLVTGSSRGVGKETVLAFANRGHIVYASMRTPENCTIKHENVIPIHLDVTDRPNIKNAVTIIIEEQGTIDVVVNNAGFGLYAPIEMVSEESMQKQFDVNVYGPVRIIQEVLPYMRKQKSGHIINISSIAGLVSSPFLGIYAATKHSIEAISEALACTVSPWNIHVSVVEPGAIATEFAHNLTVNTHQESPYEPLATNYRKDFIKRIDNGQDPTEVGELIATIAETKTPHFRYQTSERLSHIASEFITDVTGDKRIHSLIKSLEKFALG